MIGNVGDKYGCCCNKEGVVISVKCCIEGNDKLIDFFVDIIFVISFKYFWNSYSFVNEIIVCLE